MAVSNIGSYAILLACAFICGACLLTASIYDQKTHFVPDLIWWIMAVDSLFIPAMISSGTVWPPEMSWGFHPESAFDCLAVIAVQEKIMSRYYGRADSHAFSCCELFFFFLGYPMAGAVCHMSLSLAMLSFVQFIRRNIRKDLKLKKPVPFVPYISLSFVLSVIMIKTIF